jgi:hypothetical protein
VRRRLAAAIAGAAAYALVRDGLLKLWWLIPLAHSLNGHGIARSTTAYTRPFCAVSCQDMNRSCLRNKMRAPTEIAPAHVHARPIASRLSVMRRQSKLAATRGRPLATPTARLKIGPSNQQHCRRRCSSSACLRDAQS